MSVFKSMTKFTQSAIGTPVQALQESQLDKFKSMISLLIHGRQRHQQCQQQKKLETLEWQVLERKYTLQAVCKTPLPMTLQIDYSNMTQYQELGLN